MLHTAARSLASWSALKIKPNLRSGLRAMSVFRGDVFAGKTAIVTGGSTGIGRAIATELLTLGCEVVVASRNWDRLLVETEKLAAQFKPTETGRQRVNAVKCNIRDENEVENLMLKTLEWYGKIDYLVNNGGGQFASPVADMRPKGWKAVVDTNLNGTFLTCHAVFRNWMRDHGGRIVNITALTQNGFAGMAHTGAARAGVENLTKTLAVEWAHFDVQINCVAPGVVYSASAAANYGDKGAQIFQSSTPRVPAKRLGTPEEVSSAVCYLLSPAAAYVTGVSLVVDGGLRLCGQNNYTVPDHSKSHAYEWTQSESSKSKL